MRNKGYEVTVNTQLSFFKDLPERIQNQLTELQKSLLMIQQHGINNVSGALHPETEEVTFVIWCGCNGQNIEDASSESKKMLDLLKDCNPTIANKKSSITFWKDSHITIKYGNMSKVFEALSVNDDKKETANPTSRLGHFDPTI